MDLPAPIAAALARAVAAYIREAPKKDVPAHLRRVEGFRPQALKPFQKDLIGALDDDDFRGALVEWLAESPRLGKQEERVLRIAALREDGWEDSLVKTAPARKKPAPKSEEEKLRTELERERAKATKLKEEARLQRDAVRTVDRDAKETIAGLQREARGAGERVRALEGELKALRAEGKKEAQKNEKERRALRREAERAQSARLKADERVATLKREVAARERKIRELEELLDKEKRRARGHAKKAAPSSSAPRARKALRAPKGLLEDAPETLTAWLSTQDAHLLIDGYNVGMEGHPELEREPMRKRVVDKAGKLARRHGIEATVVFDGAEVAPGTARRKQGPVKIVYSPPGVIADDVIVELVEDLPPRPVVVVTNDRELQGLVRKLGATVATSNQFLALTR